MSYACPTLDVVWKRWYHVLVELPGGKRHLLAIEATSALEAQRLAEVDWGAASVREVRGAR